MRSSAGWTLLRFGRCRSGDPVGGLPRSTVGSILATALSLTHQPEPVQPFHSQWLVPAMCGYQQGDRSRDHRGHTYPAPNRVGAGYRQAEKFRGPIGDSPSDLLGQVGDRGTI